MLSSPRLSENLPVAAATLTVAAAAAAELGAGVVGALDGAQAYRAQARTEEETTRC